jgi:hypothetical protein
VQQSSRKGGNHHENIEHFLYIKSGKKSWRQEEILLDARHRIPAEEKIRALRTTERP